MSVENQEKMTESNKSRIKKIKQLVADLNDCITEASKSSLKVVVSVKTENRQRDIPYAIPSLKVDFYEWIKTRGYDFD